MSLVKVQRNVYKVQRKLHFGSISGHNKHTAHAYNDPASSGRGLQYRAPGSRSEISKRGGGWVGGGRWYLAGNGYQNCACHYNFKAGFPGSSQHRRLVVAQPGGWRSEKVGRGGGGGREGVVGWYPLGIVLRVCYRGGFGVGGKRGLPGAREGPGGKGWVIYFPPARHNLSRGFSRKHAESAAIEKKRKRDREREGWKRRVPRREEKAENTEGEFCEPRG